MPFEQNQPSRQENRLSSLWYVILLAAILLVAGICYFVCAASDPVFERAEIYFAESAREMLASARIVTPYFLGHPFFDKPILTYWGILASFRLFGATHLAARLPLILGALATLVVTAGGTTFFAERRAGLMAAAVLGSSYLFGYFAMLCMSDIFLTLFMTAGLFLLLAGSMRAGRRNLLWWLASICLGLAVLTKGPVGLVLPVAAILAYLAITRELGQIRLSHILAGSATICVLAGAWFLAVWRENGAQALYAFFINENLKRFTGSMYRTQGGFWYIPIAFFVGALPWSILLPFAAWNSIRKWRAGLRSGHGRAELLLWCYILVVIVFFWMSRMQMEYYVLPALPAFAGLTGISLSEDAPAAGLLLRSAAWIASVALFVLGIVGARYFSVLLAGGRHSGISLAPLWFSFAGLAMMVLLLRKKYLPAYATIFLAVCGGVPLSVRAMQPAYRRFLPVQDYARAVRDAGSEIPLAVSEDLDGWRSEYAFQTSRIPHSPETEQELAAFLSAPGPRMAILTEGEWQKLPPSVTASLDIVSQRIGWAHKVELGTALTASPNSTSALQMIDLVVSRAVAARRQ